MIEDIYYVKKQIILFLVTFFDFLNISQQNIRSAVALEFYGSQSGQM